MRQFITIDDHPDTSKERIARLAEQFALKPFRLSCSLDDGDVLIVETTDLGLVVTTCDLIVADERLPSSVVSVCIGGQNTPVHRRCIVSHEIAAPAVGHFLHYREAPNTLGWIPVTKLMEWEKELEREPLSDDVIIGMWLKGDRVEAVKEYRRSHSLGLKEAVEALQPLTEG
jgi:hypothetical protein